MSEIKAVFSSRFERFLLPCIILLTVVIFYPVLWNDFVAFDDDIFVYANPNIVSGLNFDTIKWAFTTGYEANWVPLSLISHALDVQLFGFNPVGHHAVNLLFHVANSGLLFLFLRKVTNAPFKSAAVACLFALHPLHVESVAWVAERRDVLSTFFLMLTLYWYALYSESKNTKNYIVTLFLFVCALLSKPMVVTLPILLLLLDWWPLNRIIYADKAAFLGVFLKLSVEKIPFCLLSLCSSIITYRVQLSVGELPQGYTFISRLGKSCIAYMTYLYKMFWPVDLAVLYPFSKYPPSTVKILCCAILLVVITTFVLWFCQKYPFILTGWLWYLISLLPVIGLIQIGQHTVADRYTYIPLIGLFVVIVWGLSQLSESWRYRNSCLCVIAACVVFGMSYLTIVQIKYWKNSENLFKHTIDVTEGNWVIHSNLGLVYLNQGRIDDALLHLNQSISIKPSYALAYLNLGAVYLATMEYDKAVEFFNWSLQFDRFNPKAHFGLGVAYTRLGKLELGMKEYQLLEELDSLYAESLMQIINTPQK